MATLNSIREGLERAWDNLAEGWTHLRERAGQAVTRFRPHGQGQLQSAEERFMADGARWGLLAAEVSEDADAVSVRLEAPGLEHDDFDISVVDDTLLVRGEKRVQREQVQGRYFVRECAYGSFERAIALPAPVDEAKARARYRRGVLTVTLPKARPAVARRIDVKSD